MLPLSWVLGLAYIMFDMSLVQYFETTGLCDYNTTWYNFSVYIILWSISQYVIPSSAILILYARVICTLRRQDNALGPQAEAERVRREAKKKVMRIIITVTLVFYLFCGIPQVAAVPANLYFPEHAGVELFDDTVELFLAVNLAFNPCAYFLFMQSFRDGFRRLFMSPRETAATVRSSALTIFSSTHFSVSVQDTKNANEQQNNEPQLLAFHGFQSNDHMDGRL